ncbi:MAG: hypothetical protein KAH32_07905 [Chlamydiia bacterium]|nr:hypothetical protein [Chlamydiia bacterium]
MAKKYTFHKSVKFISRGKKGNEIRTSIMMQLYKIGVYVAIYENDSLAQQMSLEPKEVVKGEKAVRANEPNAIFSAPITVHKVDGFWVEYTED